MKVRQPPAPFPQKQMIIARILLTIGETTVAVAVKQRSVASPDIIKKRNMDQNGVSAAMAGFAGWLAWLSWLPWLAWLGSMEGLMGG